MSILKFKNADGTWNGIAAFKGEDGKDGAIQYQAGFGINISEDNVISSTLDPNNDLTVDLVPTEGSNNPVASGGVYNALADKANTTDIPTDLGDLGNNAGYATIPFAERFAHVVDYNITDYPKAASANKKTLPQDAINDLTTYINSVYGRLERFNVILLLSHVPVFFTSSPTTITSGSGIYDFVTILSNKPTKLGFSGMFQYRSDLNTSGYSTTLATDGYLLNMTLALDISWDGNIATVTNAFLQCNAGGTDRFVGENFIEAYYLNKYNTRSYNPTKDYHPATKKYVDDKVLSAMPQKETLPEASADYLGKIYQYIGADTEDYTQGFFYQCVATTIGDVTTYSWNELTFGEVDLSNYPTLEQVLIKGNIEEYTPALDYEPATKKYVDDTVANVGGNTNSVIPYLYVSSNYYTSASVGLTEAEKTELAEYLTNSLNSTFLINIGANGVNVGLMTSTGIITTDSTSIELRCINSNVYDGQIIYRHRLNITCSCTNNVFTVTGATLSRFTTYDVTRFNSWFLRRNNTAVFTPTGDYNPATKKYVDDAVAAVSGSGGITEETDPIFTRHIASTITESDITNWNNKADEGGITTESDPTVPVWVKGITENDILNWNNKADSSAISGVVDGILANKGYITEETEPAFNASVAADITQEDIDYWNAKQNALVISNKYNGASNPVATIADIPTNYITQVNASDVGKDNYIRMNPDSAILSNPYTQLHNMLVNNGVIDYKKVLANFDLCTIATSSYNGEPTTYYSVLLGEVYSVDHAEESVYNSAIFAGSTLSGTDGDYDTMIKFKPYYTTPQVNSSYYEISRYEFSLFVNSANILSGVEGNYALVRSSTTMKLARYTG